MPPNRTTSIKGQTAVKIMAEIMVLACVAYQSDFIDKFLA
jgi:hypothetical protein